MATRSVDKSASASQSPVLIVAAMSRELGALRRKRPAGISIIETGEGMKNAADALGRWFEKNNASAVVATGFAGALSPQLQIGDMVIAREIHAGNQVISVKESNLLRAVERVKIDNRAIHFGVAITVDQIIVTAEAKRRLAEGFARNEIACVDMESFAVAQECSRRGIPFLIVRAITDAMNEDLPVDFNRCRAADGRINSLRVMRAALARPRAIKGWSRLMERSDFCADSLAEFVARVVKEIN